ncbi:hypothetical protein CVT24_004031 [Panaeolus cyanescens]|uniref:BHLH domain-containing protein n=1 Tax=Panaeolus cyanescens TaxID=181874 RepID=A0A409Y6A3_9AGAR|nr:hypothetical protein CVT24_004031 [Panaeolus cyanescens]
MPERPKRTRGQQPKPGLTQKSLLDLFTAKNNSKLQDQAALSTQDAQPVEQLDLSNDTNDDIDIITNVSPNLSGVPDVYKDAVSQAGVPLPETRRRSPPIVIVDNTSETGAPDVISSVSSQSHVASSGHSADEPIVICSSPIKVSSFPHAKSDKPTHPFFTLRAKTKPAKSIPNARSTKPVVYEVPYPDATSQHVKGFQTSPRSTACPFPPRTSPENAKPLPAPLLEYKFLKVDTIAKEVEHKLDGAERIVDGHENFWLDVPIGHRTNHPAISRLLNQVPGETHASRRPWSEKWRPTCAQEVLGNEKNAIYLRNWLKALELQLESNTDHDGGGAGELPSVIKPKPLKRALKRPRVIRAVDKSRRRKKSKLDSDEEDDSWIVQTDEEDDYDVPYQESSDGFSDDILPEPASSPPSSSDIEELPGTDVVFDALGQLHNTILLTGPSGSGKTASIYACAEELGWDVFEVYPGVGRRNGSNVDNLIGEVGKNHLVHQKQRHSGDALKFLRQKQRNETEEEDLVNVGAMYSPRKSDIKTAISSIDGPNLPRQSVILLEEVDILFKDDVNFWSTVTRIIKECKRPVIYISLVPIQELPLQTILEFRACPSETATSYLQSLCRAEGFAMDREPIMKLYSGHKEQEDSWSTSTLPSTCDLRRAIYGLQVSCTSGNDMDSRSRAQSQGPELRGINEPEATKRGAGGGFNWRQSEYLSFIDCELVLDKTQSLMIKELAGYSSCSDDEIGHAILHDVYAKNSAQIGLHDRQEEIARSAIQVSQPRPTSPFVFGDPPQQEQQQPSHLRKILHSPLPDHPSHRSISNLSHDSHELSRTNHSASSITKDSMLVDHDRHSLTSRRNFRDPPAFDFSMRRHSIAVGQNPITLPHLSSALGTKRKMSDDRTIFAPVGEDSDTPLVGPGVPSIMDVDTEGPAPKRRGSTIDTQRIAQLSLNDRRNSVDSRSSHWIANDRRDSAPSLFHNVPGISSFNAGFNSSDSHTSRAPSSLANFSWPNSSSDTTNTSNDSNHHNRSFESSNGQLSLVPPINYPPDRRMSVPDTLTHPASSRSLRSRSRPPSRQNTDSNNQSSQEDTPNPSSGGKSGKESGMTPYSRSPELRVSHKLAERKRRKEMKDLFDELRDQLPADRGMKASKWEILSKAIDFVAQLKRSHQDMAQEIEVLRAQLHAQRGDGLSGYPPNGPASHNGFGSSSSGIMGQFPPPPPIIPPLQTPQNHTEPRTNSSQNLFSNSHNPPTQNGTAAPSHRIDGASP